MKKQIALSTIILFVLLLSVNAFGDYLEVRRSANIKADPVSDARTIEKVQAGINLQLLDDGKQTNGYYNVETVSQGTNGWIYRTLVRRHTGEIPEPVPQGEITDPLRDSTYSDTPEQRRYAARHLRIGKPQAVYERV